MKITENSLLRYSRMVKIGKSPLYEIRKIRQMIQVKFGLSRKEADDVLFGKGIPELVAKINAKEEDSV